MPMINTFIIYTLVTAIIAFVGIWLTGIHKKMMANRRVTRALDKGKTDNNAVKALVNHTFLVPLDIIMQSPFKEAHEHLTTDEFTKLQLSASVQQGRFKLKCLYFIKGFIGVGLSWLWFAVFVGFNQERIPHFYQTFGYTVVLLITGMYSLFAIRWYLLCYLAYRQAKRFSQ